MPVRAITLGLRLVPRSRGNPAEETVTITITRTRNDGVEETYTTHAMPRVTSRSAAMRVESASMLEFPPLEVAIDASADRSFRFVARVVEVARRGEPRVLEDAELGSLRLGASELSGNATSLHLMNAGSAPSSTPPFLFFSVSAPFTQDSRWLEFDWRAILRHEVPRAPPPLSRASDVPRAELGSWKERHLQEVSLYIDLSLRGITDARKQQQRRPHALVLILYEAGSDAPTWMWGPVLSVPAVADAQQGQQVGVPSAQAHGLSSRASTGCDTFEFYGTSPYWPSPEGARLELCHLEAVEDEEAASFNTAVRVQPTSPIVTGFMPFTTITSGRSFDVPLLPANVADLKLPLGARHVPMLTPRTMTVPPFHHKNGSTVRDVMTSVFVPHQTRLPVGKLHSQPPSPAPPPLKPSPAFAAAPWHAALWKQIIRALERAVEAHAALEEPLRHGISARAPLLDAPPSTVSAFAAQARCCLELRDGAAGDKDALNARIARQMHVNEGLRSRIKQTVEEEGRVFADLSNESSLYRKFAGGEQDFSERELAAKLDRVQRATIIKLAHEREDLYAEVLHCESHAGVMRALVAAPIVAGLRGIDPAISFDRAVLQSDAASLAREKSDLLARLAQRDKVMREERARSTLLEAEVMEGRRAHGEWLKQQRRQRGFGGNRAHTSLEAMLQLSEAEGGLGGPLEDEGFSSDDTGVLCPLVLTPSQRVKIAEVEAAAREVVALRFAGEIARAKEASAREFSAVVDEGTRRCAAVEQGHALSSAADFVVQLKDGTRIHEDAVAAVRKDAAMLSARLEDVCRDLEHVHTIIDAGHRAAQRATMAQDAHAHLEHLRQEVREAFSHQSIGSWEKRRFFMHTVDAAPYSPALALRFSAHHAQLRATGGLYRLLAQRDAHVEHLEMLACQVSSVPRAMASPAVGSASPRPPAAPPASPRHTHLRLAWASACVELSALNNALIRELIQCEAAHGPFLYRGVRPLEVIRGGGPLAGAPPLGEADIMM